MSLPRHLGGSGVAALLAAALGAYPAAPRAELPEAFQPVPDAHPNGGPVVPAPWWNASFQSTYVLQRKPGFSAEYTGPHSLLTTPETGYTLTGTLYLGVRAWKGAEIFFNAEAIQSREISDLTGLGGLSNGENQKSGGALPSLYVARAFLRQTIGLGGETFGVEPGPNQLGATVPRRRLVITAGNFALTDVFYNNTFSHDPRTQFLNWAFLTYGASDYAADTRGYTWGLAVEYYHDDWAFRAGRFAQATESNGSNIDFDLLDHYGDSVEIEHAHSVLGQPGKLSVAGFRNYARMGNFRDALAYSAAHGGAPSVANVRRNQAKLGFGASLEQNLFADVGMFVRYSYNDGQTETYAFTEIDRSLTVGVSVKGERWRREGDTLGVAWAMNGLSDAHREYLAAGGLGFFIGEGRLDYRLEQILEAYYSFNAFRGFWFTVDAQRIVNPAYNAARGPVDFIGCRFHVEY